MIQKLAQFIREKQINSFQKLRFLLFLRQYPRLYGCLQQIADQMYLEAPLVEQMIAEFQAVGLLEGRPFDYRLRDEPGLKGYLDELLAAFEHPLTRQELLELVKKDNNTLRNPSPSQSDSPLAEPAQLLKAVP
jgi:hypothetical protein